MFTYQWVFVLFIFADALHDAAAMFTAATTAFQNKINSIKKNE